MSGQIIQFNTGDINQIHRINITQDIDCEDNPNEHFSSNIVLDSGVQPIEVIRPEAVIFINDTAEPECGKSHLTSFSVVETPSDIVYWSAHVLFLSLNLVYWLFHKMGGRLKLYPYPLTYNIYYILVTQSCFSFRTNPSWL